MDGPRPTMSNVPATVHYGTTFSINSPQAQDITKVRLIRPGSATHSFDMDQRSMELNSTYQASTGKRRITAPANEQEAPRGYYMLFIATGPNGSTPSEATWIKLARPLETQ